MILRSCPFCGFRDEARLGQEDPAPGLRVCAESEELEDRSWWVECDNCLAQGPNAPDETQARVEWNKRGTDGKVHTAITRCMKFNSPWSREVATILGEVL